MRLINLSLTAILLAVFGCSTVKTDESFNDVSALTEPRLNSSLIWNKDETAAREIEHAINQILAKPLVVSDAVQIALLNSPSVQAIYEDVGIAQADLIQAGLLQNPTFSIERRF